MSPPQLLPRLHAQLIYQAPTDVRVRLQRLGLPASAIHGDHERSPEGLAEGVLGCQRLEFDHLETARREVEVGPALQHLKPPLNELWGNFPDQVVGVEVNKRF